MNDKQESSSQLIQHGAVTVEAIFNAPLAFVWKMLGRFSSISDWQDSVVDCFIEEREDGIYRAVVMQDNSAFIERLETFSNEDKSFSYSIKSGPIPVSECQCKISFSSVGTDSTHLIWSASFAVKPPYAVDGIEENLRNLFNNGITGMRRLLEK